MDIFSKRRKKLNLNMADQKALAVLINHPANLYYYTGFTGGEAFFLMPQNICDGDYHNSMDKEWPLANSIKVCAETEELGGYIITDSRYYEQVERECPSLTLVKMEQKGYSETIKDLLIKLIKDGVIQKPAENLCIDAKAKEEDGMPVIAIEDSMEVQQYRKLCNACGGYAFLPGSEWIDESRMIKDEEELQKIAKAEQIGDMAFTHVLSVIKPGITEADVALELEFFMKRQGASGLSFDTIVASGSNSSMPHAKVTNRLIENGDFVTMDFGCIYEGYCSDMTRTVVVGTPTEEMRKVYQIVLDANLRAMEGIRQGVSCREIDALARDYIRDCGYGDYFGHGLGHGVGLQIHEEPRFSPKCDIVIKENMVITDEPGIYLPGRFGVRIEDLLVVKEDACEKLSCSEKELIIL